MANTSSSTPCRDSRSCATLSATPRRRRHWRRGQPVAIRPSARAGGRDDHRGWGRAHRDAVAEIHGGSLRLARRPGPSARDRADRGGKGEQPGLTLDRHTDRRTERKDQRLMSHTTGPSFGIMTAPMQVSYRDVLRVWREAEKNRRLRDIEILVAHEGAHTFHASCSTFRLNDTVVGEGLFIEGLAIVASILVSPGTPEVAYLCPGGERTLQGQDCHEWLAECDNRWPELRRLLLRDMERSDQGRFAAYFWDCGCKAIQPGRRHYQAVVDTSRAIAW